MDPHTPIVDMTTPLDRRAFLGLTAGAVAGTFFEPAPLSAASAKAQVRAVAFDAFPIFDPRPVLALAEELFPGKGTELSKVWRTRQFEYAWLRTVAGHYADFWQVTEEALKFAARTAKVDLDSQKRAQLMDAYLELKTWPDVPHALASLKAAGIRLAFLSNFSKRMLEAGIKSSGLAGTFEHVLSTDEVKQFKPARRAYQMAVDAFGLKREAILFAAFAGWDAAGAKWFGYPTVWVNRLQSPAEELAVMPDATCHDLMELAALATSQQL
jgi:2-haloacid dehalogenase